MTDFNKDHEHQHISLSLENGWRMSIVQGYGTYSNDGSAEVAIIDNKGKFRRVRGMKDDVLGHVHAYELSSVIRLAHRLSQKGST